MDKLKNNWAEIQNYQKIRNAIVHDNSSIMKKKGVKLQQQPLYNYVKNHKSLNLNEQTGIVTIVDNNYLIEFCELIENYLYQIYIQAETKI